jgi:hypothetical protein
VRNMDIGHDPVIIPEAGDAAALHCAPIEGAVLANGIAIPYLQSGLGAFALIFLILRIIANGTKLRDPIVPADLGWAIDHRMRADPGIITDLDIRADDRPRTYADSYTHLGIRMNDSARVNQ